MTESDIQELWYSLSGLEFVQATIDGQISLGSMAETMGIKAVKADQGFLGLEAVPTAEHLNPAGTVHGGYAATVLDMVTGIVVQTVLDAGQSCATVDLNVQMIKPLALGKAVKAEGHLIRRTTNLAFTRGSLMDDNGDIYAHAQSTVMIFTGRK